MDIAVCREHLEKLIVAEHDALGRLAELLDREYDVICKNDVEELDRAGDARQACIVELAHIQTERHSLCRMMNLPRDQYGLERLLHWCDPSSQLQQRWAACADSARRCRDANERNGALVTARLKRVEGLLGVITGGATRNSVYAANGAAQNTRTGQLLTTRV